MWIKSILSSVAIIVTFAAFLPYILSILKGDVRPHMFSWIIWGMTTVIVFFAQLAAKGGIGAWPIGISGCITLFVATLAYVKRADVKINRLDYVFLTLALLSLPLWFFTADPFWAVLILTVVDLLGFGPTFNKAYRSPYSESVTFFTLFTLRNILVLLALESYSLTTLLFPAAIATTTIILIAMIMIRRRLLSPERRLSR